MGLKNGVTKIDENGLLARLHPDRSPVGIDRGGPSLDPGLGWLIDHNKKTRGQTRLLQIFPWTYSGREVPGQCCRTNMANKRWPGEFLINLWSSFVPTENIPNCCLIRKRPDRFFLFRDVAEGLPLSIASEASVFTLESHRLGRPDLSTSKAFLTG